MKKNMIKIIFLVLNIAYINSMQKRSLKNEDNLSNKKLKFSLFSALSNEIKLEILIKNLEQIIYEAKNFSEFEKNTSKFLAQISLINKDFKYLIDLHKNYLLKISMSQNKKNNLLEELVIKSYSQENNKCFVENIIKLIEIGADSSLSICNLPKDNNLKMEFDQLTLLEYSAVTGKLLPVIEFLVENKLININDKDSLGYTALTFASKTSNKEAIELFIRLGADVNLQDNEGNSALIINLLERQPNCDIIKFLLENGADKYLKNIYGENALNILEQDDVYIAQDIKELFN